ncbi:MAG: sugar kinase [Chloroflexota bacterium]
MSALSVKRYDVTAFGESMLRLSVPAGTRLARMDQLDVHLAGAESNVLAGLACLGHSGGWFGGVPEHAIGDFLETGLRRAGVATHAVAVPDSRIGTYYVEFAVPPRSTDVIYDRANSAITQLTPADIDFETLLDSRLVHLTGITPALGQGPLEIVQAILAKAAEAKVPVSFDVNYRSKLWSAGDAAQMLRTLITQVDLLLCGKRDAETLFDCRGTPEQIIEQLHEMSGAKRYVLTLGGDGVLGWDGDRWCREPARPVEIVDRVGAGDALAAGVIHGHLLNDFELGLKTGSLLAALALSQTGDMLVTTAEEVNQLLMADPGGAGIVR